MQQLDIVELIEKNPISKLSNAFNNKLLNKIKENFTGFEQQLFVGSFYCYLNYDKNMDFVVDLDNVWKWLGFASKFTAIRTLETHFKNDLDYKKSASQLGEALSNEEKPLNLQVKQDKTALPIHKAVLNETKIKQNGGQNRQIIMLTVNHRLPIERKAEA